jgi:hypothetical protein
MNYVRLIVSLISHSRWKIQQMDVKNTFFHGDVSEQIFMEQAPNFVRDSNLVFQLKKSLYGLKHTPTTWYDKTNNFFL